MDPLKLGEGLELRFTTHIGRYRVVYIWIWFLNLFFLIKWSLLVTDNKIVITYYNLI